MSTLNILQDIVNNGLGTLYVGKFGKKKPNSVGVAEKCGILIDKAFVAKTEVDANASVYLDGKDLLQASLDCYSITGRYLIQNHNPGNALSKYGMVLVPDASVKLNLDVAAEYIDRIKAA